MADVAGVRCRGTFVGERDGVHIHFGPPHAEEQLPVVQGVIGEAMYVTTADGEVLAAMDLEGNLGLRGTLFGEWSERVSTSIEHAP